MANNKDFYIELIFKKLKNNQSKKINLEKNEITKFINFLINNS